MKKRIFLLCLSVIFVCGEALAQTAYTVKTVPNTRLSSNCKHVSNPDGIIDPNTELRIDSLLSLVRDKADVFMVAVNSIGDAEINGFSNELFNYWGIGDAERDDGVLMMFVGDVRQIRFEVGYGVEPVLTDALCKRIQENAMVPLFKEGKYSEGLYAGAEYVFNVLGDEEYATSHDEYDDDDIVFDKGFWLAYGAVNILLCLIVFVVEIPANRKRKKEIMEGTEKNDKTGSGFGCLGALSVLFPIVWLAFLYSKIAANRQRKHPRTCTKCRRKMRLLTEEEEDRYLSDKQIFEENLKSRDYDVWHCDGCGDIYILIYNGKKSGRYSTCGKCDYIALKKTGDKTIAAATTTQSGIGERTYHCEHCGHTKIETYTIPKISSTSGSGGRGSFGGGSFGGGHSGGGGATSRW